MITLIAFLFDFLMNRLNTEFIASFLHSSILDACVERIVFLFFFMYRLPMWVSRPPFEAAWWSNGSQGYFTKLWIDKSCHKVIGVVWLVIGDEGLITPVSQLKVSFVVPNWIKIENLFSYTFFLKYHDPGLKGEETDWGLILICGFLSLKIWPAFH